MRKLLVLPLLLLGACDNQDGTAKPGGIFSGSAENVPNAPFLLGIVDENGNARFVETTTPSGTNLYYVIDPGIIVPHGDGFSANFVDFFDVTQTSSGTFSGSINSRSAMKLTDSMSGGTDQYDLAFDAADYNKPASFATIAGSYSFTYGNADVVTGTLVISASGTITGSDSADCSYSGAVTIPAPAFNAYDVSLSSACFGATPLLGVAALLQQTNGAPDVLLAIVDNAEAGLALSLTPSGS